MPLKSPEQAVRAALLANATVAASVGTRIYPVIGPYDAQPPLLTYRRSAVQRQQSLTGPTGITTVTLVVDVIALTYEAARGLADDVRKCLDGWGGTLENADVRNVSLETESDGFVQLAGSEVPPVFTVQMTFSILWQET
jgi:hypothetical protein